MFRLVKGWLVYVPLAAQNYPFETDLLRHQEAIEKLRRVVEEYIRRRRPTPKGATFPALYAQDPVENNIAITGPGPVSINAINAGKVFTIVNFPDDSGHYEYSPGGPDGRLVRHENHDIHRFEDEGGACAA